MKVPTDAMLALALEDIGDRQRAVHSRQRQCSLDDDRLRQSREAAVPPAVSQVSAGVGYLEVLGVGLLEHAKQPRRAELVLLFAVDAHRGCRPRTWQHTGRRT